MECRNEDGIWLVRLEKGEKVREQLALFAKEHAIKGGTVSAIGAFDWAELLYFDEEAEVYRNKTFSGGLEVLTLNGNLSLLEEGEPMVHLHATLGRDDYSVIGGHLNEALVSVTLETFIVPTSAIHRKVPFGPFKLWQLK